MFKRVAFVFFKATLLIALYCGLFYFCYLNKYWLLYVIKNPYWKKQILVGCLLLFIPLFNFFVLSRARVLFQYLLKLFIVFLVAVLWLECLLVYELGWLRMDPVYVNSTWVWLFIGIPFSHCWQFCNFPERNSLRFLPEFLLSYLMFFPLLVLPYVYYKEVWIKKHVFFMMGHHLFFWFTIFVFLCFFVVSQTNWNRLLDDTDDSFKDFGFWGLVFGGLCLGVVGSGSWKVYRRYRFRWPRDFWKWNTTWEFPYYEVTDIDHIYDLSLLVFS